MNSNVHKISYRFKFVGANLCFVLFLFCGLVAELQSAEVRDIRIWRAPDHTRVVFDLSEQKKFKLFSLQNPERVVIDMSSGKMRADLKSLDFSKTPLKKIRSSSTKKGFRIVLDLDARVKPKAFSLGANQQYGERLVIDLYDADNKTVKKEENYAIKKAEEKSGKRDLIIAIDAGHGGEDPGAIGPRKIKEKDVVLSISRILKAKFDAEKGYRAFLVREGDYYIGLRDRRKIAERRGADMFISIHADAFRDRRVAGSSVYALSNTGASSASAQYLADVENSADQIGGVIAEENDTLKEVLLDLMLSATMEASEDAAKGVLDEMGEVSKLHKRDVEFARFAVLKSPQVPSMLIETGFISNPSEAKRLATKSHQRTLANSIFKGIKGYFTKHALEGTWVYWSQNNKTNEQKALSGGHKVASGETLSGIAVKYSVSLNALKRLNNLKNDKIRVGQVLQIPAKSS